MHVPRSVKGALTVAFCALQVDALVSRSPLSQINALLPRHLELLPRQFEGTVCDSQCSVFQNAVDTCTTVSCICTSQVERGLQSCITCAVNASPTAAVINSAEQLVNTYEDACVGASITVPNPTRPTTTTSRSLPVSSPSSIIPDPTTPIVPSLTSPTVTAPTLTPTQTQSIISTLPGITSASQSTDIPASGSGSDGVFPDDGDSGSGSGGLLPGSGSGASALQQSTSIGIVGIVLSFMIFTVA